MKSLIVASLLLSLVGCKNGIFSPLHDPEWDAHYNSARIAMSKEFSVTLRDPRAVPVPSPLDVEVRWLIAHNASENYSFIQQHQKIEDLQFCQLENLMTKITWLGKVRVGDSTPVVPSPQITNCIERGSE